MKLKDWMTSKSIKGVDFAAQVRVSSATISLLCSGERMPSVELAQRIEKATRGQVKLGDWVKETAE